VDNGLLGRYFRYYYQLHKNVDEQMMIVLRALLQSKDRDDTIVVFTSDHGDLLGSHHDMHQKWYTAYEEAIRVPLIVYNEKLFPKPRQIDTLTSHIDIVPTLLGLAGIDPEPIRRHLSVDHSDARPFVGRNLTPLLLGQVSQASVNDPLYFMTDDDPSRGPNQDNWTGIATNSVVQPNHIETVIARLDDESGPKVWKYTRYFDNIQFWSSPDTPEDVIQLQKGQIPTTEGTSPILYEVTVKFTPKGDEFEMYNVTDDPMELANLHNDPRYAAEQSTLAGLLQQQCAQKRLTPCSGSVPGQPTCAQPCSN
jgi:choline-sulfatase